MYSIVHLIFHTRRPSGFLFPHMKFQDDGLSEGFVHAFQHRTPMAVNSFDTGGKANQPSHDRVEEFVRKLKGARRDYCIRKSVTQLRLNHISAF